MFHPPDTSSRNLNLPPGVHAPHGAMQWVKTTYILAPKLKRLALQTLRWFLTFQPYRIRYQAGLRTLRGFGICWFAQGPDDWAEQGLCVCAVSDSCLVFWSSVKFSRYKRAEDARMALEQMEGFELAGRTVWHFKSQNHRLSFNSSYSWESTQSMRRVLCDTHNRIHWTKLAVSLLMVFQNVY